MLLNKRKQDAISRTRALVHGSEVLARKLLLSIVLCGAFFASPASALNSIALDPDFLTVSVGDTFTVDLTMSFDDSTVGGGVEIYFDSNFDFVSFAWNPAFQLLANFGLAAPPDGSTAQPLEVAFGYFNFLNPTSGLSGTHTIGSLTFTANNEGDNRAIWTAASPLSPGPFYSPAHSTTPMIVAFGGTQITVQDAATPTGPGTIVPEPATALMMFLGLAGLSIYPSNRRRG